MGETRILIFTIPALPPRELWPNRAKPGPNWTTKAWLGRQAKIKADYESFVWGFAMKAHREMPGFGWQPFFRCTLKLQFIVPSRRSYDEDNLVAAFKCGRDALVKAGVLLSDGPAYILSTEIPAPIYEKGVEAVRVMITEVLR